jgi:photosystem II stability/assembly factor-like uncharacterized protein
MRFVVKMVAMALGLLGAARAGESGFKDPLDVPATVVATNREIVLTGLALAGNRLVMVGPRGVILYEDLPAPPDARPVQANVPVGSDLTALRFVDAKVGYAVGHDGVILGTNDGGATWDKRLDGRDVPKIIADYYAANPATDPAIARQAERFATGGADLHFLDTWFEDADHGFAIGSFNLILRTEDGGRSWKPWLDRTDNPGGLHLQAIAPIDGSVYLVGEQGLIRKLDPAAKKFVSMPSPYKGTLFGIIGGKGTILAYGLRGHAFVSHDGAATWQESKVGVTDSIAAGTMLPDGRVLLATLAGDLLTSSDSGGSFTAVPGGPRHKVFALALAQGRLALAGSSGLQFFPMP